MLASVWNDGVYILVGQGFWSPLGAGSPPDKLVYEAVYDGSQGIVGTQSGASRWGVSSWQPIPAIQQTAFAVALDELGSFAGQRTTVSPSVPMAYYGFRLTGFRRALAVEFQVRVLALT